MRALVVIITFFTVINSYASDAYINYALDASIDKLTSGDADSLRELFSLFKPAQVAADRMLYQAPQKALLSDTEEKQWASINGWRERASSALIASVYQACAPNQEILDQVFRLPPGHPAFCSGIAAVNLARALVGLKSSKSSMQDFIYMSDSRLITRQFPEGQILRLNRSEANFADLKVVCSFWESEGIPVNPDGTSDKYPLCVFMKSSLYY